MGWTFEWRSPLVRRSWNGSSAWRWAAASTITLTTFLTNGSRIYSEITCFVSHRRNGGPGIGAKWRSAKSNDNSDNVLNFRKRGSAVVVEIVLVKTTAPAFSVRSVSSVSSIFIVRRSCPLFIHSRGNLGSVIFHSPTLSPSSHRIRRAAITAVVELNLIKQRRKCKCKKREERPRDRRRGVIPARKRGNVTRSSRTPWSYERDEQRRRRLQNSSGKTRSLYSPKSIINNKTFC